MSSFDNQDSDQAALLSDFALEELQLRQQPFTVEPAGGESFMDGIAEAQLDDIKQALISGDDLLLILGPEGSGKSTLLNQLGANSGQRIQCFSVRGSERFSTANLFAGMLEAFKKQPPNDLKLMLDELIPCLQGMADQNTLGAVVLDDADSIQEAELTKLLSGMLYLNSSDETLLRVTLAAPTEFEERIPELLPEGADLPYSSLAIEAFDKDRSAAYLDYRLQLAGLAGDFPFNDSEIAVINEEAGGRPGHLHRVAAATLNSRDTNYVADLPPELTESKKSAAGSGFLNQIGGTKLLVGAAALAMIFAGMFWLKPNGNNVPDDRYTVVENKKLETDRQQAQELVLQKEQEARDKLAAEQLANETEATTNSSNNTTVVVPETAVVANNEQTAAQKAEAAKAEAQRQAKIEADAAAKAAQDKRDKEQAEQARLAAEKAAEEKARLAAEKAKADAEAAATQAGLSNLESPNWILVQNPALFTVQMSASKDRQSVESFLARNDLEPPNSIFSFERNDTTWYALVHGLYSSIEEARRDIETMPASARSNQPWIRAVSRIQNALKE